jgi:phospholipid/cholesterol/gamma-HCH transport system substrate-binding protein
MSKSSLEWKVGLWVLIGLVLLAGLMIQFSKGTSLFESCDVLHLYAANLGGGLKPNASVLMSGVEVGKVAGIRLAPGGGRVEITLKIYHPYFGLLHKDARFVIEQSGFLGDQYVAILPTENKAPLFRNGDEAEAPAPFNLQEVARSAGGFIQRVDETARRLNSVIDELQKHVLNEQTLTNFSVAVNNLRLVSEEALTAVGNLSSVIASNGPAIGESATNLVAFSERVNEFALSLDQVVATNREGIAAVVTNLQASTQRLDDLLADVQAGKGPAGALLRDDQLANHLSLVVSNLSVTTSNLNRFGLWHMLWQPKQPKPPKTQPPPNPALFEDVPPRRP